VDKVIEGIVNTGHSSRLPSASDAPPVDHITGPNDGRPTANNHAAVVVMTYSSHFSDSSIDNVPDAESQPCSQSPSLIQNESAGTASDRSPYPPDRPSFVTGSGSGADAVRTVCPFADFQQEEIHFGQRVQVNRCPFNHGSVGTGPFPGYVHGARPAICSNGCM
jgi:hypothetical protein